jgi:hypothetical protein
VDQYQIIFNFSTINQSISGQISLYCDLISVDISYTALISSDFDVYPLRVDTKGTNINLVNEDPGIIFVDEYFAGPNISYILGTQNITWE